MPTPGSYVTLKTSWYQSQPSLRRYCISASLLLLVCMRVCMRSTGLCLRCNYAHSIEQPLVVTLMMNAQLLQCGGSGTNAFSAVNMGTRQLLALHCGIYLHPPLPNWCHEEIQPNANKTEHHAAECLSKRLDCCYLLRCASVPELRHLCNRLRSTHCCSNHNCCKRGFLICAGLHFRKLALYLHAACRCGVYFSLIDKASTLHGGQARHRNTQCQLFRWQIFAFVWALSLLES
jgi:hypothetical protein